MTETLKDRFAMDATVLSIGLMAVVLSSVGLVLVLSVQQVGTGCVCAKLMQVSLRDVCRL